MVGQGLYIHGQFRWAASDGTPVMPMALHEALGEGTVTPSWHPGPPGFRYRGEVARHEKAAPRWKAGVEEYLGKRTTGAGLRVFTDSRTFKGKNVGMRLRGAVQVERSLLQGLSNYSPPWPSISVTQESLYNAREVEATGQDGGPQGEVGGGRAGQCSEWGWLLQRGTTRKVGAPPIYTPPTCRARIKTC